MDGKPFKVGRFAHTLRMRLMWEHLGVDVDAMYEEDIMAKGPVGSYMKTEGRDPDNDHQPKVAEVGVTSTDPTRQDNHIGIKALNFQQVAMQGTSAFD